MTTLSLIFKRRCRGHNPISWQRRAAITLAAAYLFCALLQLNARGAIYSSTYNSGFQNSGLIPDGSLNGLSDTRTLSGISQPQISDVKVTLNLSGGYNGDLYAYLSHGSTGFAVLLNR